MASSASDLAHNRPGLDLGRFAKEFDDEAHLRAVIAELLPRTGATGVRVTHGPSERGKDIVFYKTGGLSKEILYACVVKKERITGRADSKSGAQTVLNQALQALGEPYTNRVSGAEEKAHTVYIMCPFESTSEAIESIKTQLRERSRQVEFICGIDLLALFQDYWPDFLRFESAIQTRYLTSLRAGIVIDKALITLLTKHNGNLGLKPFEAFYVPTTIELRLDRFERPEMLPPLPGLFKKHVTQAEFEDSVYRLSFWKQALIAEELLPQRPDGLKNLTKFIEEFAAAAPSYWNKALHTKRRRQSEPDQPEERFISFSDTWVGFYELCADVFSALSRRLSGIRRAARLLEEHAKSLSAATPGLLRNDNLLQVAAAYDYVAILPAMIKHSPGRAISIDPENLFSNCRAALISGPPGSGKTSFCRWETIKAVDLFSSDRGNPVPIYVPASKLASSPVSTFEEAFLGGADFVSLWSSNNPISVSMRLFLDGLDEVPDRDQQQRIIELLREGLDKYSGLTVIVTSRPYVWGRWLNWMPRFHIAEMARKEQEKLATNWLDNSAQVENFFKELDQSAALQRLMGIPLLAMLILNLYRRTPRIPESKASLYRAFVDLYCGGWDAAKGGFQRGQYQSEQKLRPLAALAYRMHLNNQPECSEEMFTQALRATAPRFAETSGDFLTEVIQDGILVRAGKELLFSHLSFQEYLAAQYLASDPTGQRPSRALGLFLEGQDWWKEVTEFYVISRDDPSALSSWISRIAKHIRGKGKVDGGDLIRRLHALALCVRESFPGYSPSFDTPK